ncbi:MAG: metallophosphoesterase [Phycisphaeraceae bacterium]
MTTSAQAHKPFTIAVLSDMHFGDPPTIAARRGEFGAELLRRAVERFNRFIQPDLVLVLGDLLDDPEAERAEADLKEMRAILDPLACPSVVIPGNHDPAAERFYEVIERPGEMMDFGGRVRVLPFVDPEAPGYHAQRVDADLARLRAARRDGFDGFVIAAQHVPVRPRGAELKHTFTNLDAVLEAVHAGGVDLCVAGHSHQACESVHERRCGFFAVGALCEAPHAYALITLDDENTPTVRKENLAMDADLGLVDHHSHTQFAYCAKTVHTQRSPAFAEMMGLRGLALTEHSGQLYFNVYDFGSGKFCEHGIAKTNRDDWRIEDFLQTVERIQTPRLLRGLEVDADFQGEQVLLEAHRRQLQVVVGAVHFLPESIKPAAQRDAERFVEQFQFVTERLCRTGIHILAHPFRIFRRSDLPVPQRLYPWLADVLRETGVASELNYHTNEPHEAFVRMCLDRGVKLSFGGDAHHLWEVGEFYPHLKLLERVGVAGRPGEVLIDLMGDAVAAG